MRMGMRRFTRLTNGHSKKVENHGHQVALYFFHYNFCRVHSMLRVTPAMEAGLTDHVWTLDELMLQAKNESGAVVGVRCISCGTIALYEDGKVPDDILAQKCKPLDSSQNALRIVREATEGK